MNNCFFILSKKQISRCQKYVEKQRGSGEVKDKDNYKKDTDN
jgi:hypothetical protein